MQLTYLVLWHRYITLLHGCSIHLSMSILCPWPRNSRMYTWYAKVSLSSMHPLQA